MGFPTPLGFLRASYKLPMGFLWASYGLRLRHPGNLVSEALPKRTEKVSQIDTFGHLFVQIKSNFEWSIRSIRSIGSTWLSEAEALLRNQTKTATFIMALLRNQTKTATFIMDLVRNQTNTATFILDLLRNQKERQLCL